MVKKKKTTKAPLFVWSLVPPKAKGSYWFQPLGEGMLPVMVEVVSIDRICFYFPGDADCYRNWPEGMWAGPVPLPVMPEKGLR